MRPRNSSEQGSEDNLGRLDTGKDAHEQIVVFPDDHLCNLLLLIVTVRVGVRVGQGGIVLRTESERIGVWRDRLRAGDASSVSVEDLVEVTYDCVGAREDSASWVRGAHRGVREPLPLA